eukprot:TRINITY_DN7602_c0_g1_i6.p1 TRINITY_DN7602_c0_g1~~TRINITY_DN7602_c0_g1_i6.p1  ORF type:complete len:614 (+),score=110.15 TRINITY_DN7602_c0_g1_i6:63-1904(+)
MATEAAGDEHDEATAAIFHTAAYLAGLKTASVATTASLFGGVSAASAAACALAVKVYCGGHQQAIAERLADVQKFVRARVYSGGAEPQETASQLLELVDRYLAAEEQLRHNSFSNYVYDILAGPPARATGVVEAENTAISDSQFRKQIKQVRKICADRTSQTAARQKRRGQSESKSSSSRSEHMFNPQWQHSPSQQGLCSALGYLLRSFLKLRRHSQGSLGDGQRVALRLAVSALSRHSVFDDLKDHGALTEPSEHDKEHRFRSTALAILCILDKALSWKPFDPLGWCGKSEDEEDAVLARGQDYCSFPHWASKLRRCWRSACHSSEAAKSRLEESLDVMRSRKLPKPWRHVWVKDDEASMLVRNKTKVPLRVELYKLKKSTPSLSASWPLLRSFFSVEADQAVLVANVRPGIEWALRPKAVDGSKFKINLVTASGVVVCSRRLRRGQTFDFSVPVPPRPAAVSNMAAVVDTRAPPLRAMKSESEESIRTISLVTAPSSLGQPAAAQATDEQEDVRSEVRLVPGSFQASMCPRCLHSMPLRHHRPKAAIYSAGVRCDKCSVELLMPARTATVISAESEAATAFCHCIRCWYDLCQHCAYKEMEEVWWRQSWHP